MAADSNSTYTTSFDFHCILQAKNAHLLFACSCELARVYMRLSPTSRSRVHATIDSRVHATPRPFGRLERQAWRPLTTEGSGLSAGSKLPRSFLGVLGEGSGLKDWQTAGLKALSNRGQWPECRVEAAAEGFRGFRRLRAGKRQAWTSLTTEGSGLTAGKRQAWRPLTTEGSGLSAWSKMPRSIVGVSGVWGLANGRLERP